MAQFTCEICGEGFEQKSRYERHVMTSHPDQAVSVADIGKALKGADFPLSRDALVKTAGQQADKDVVAVLKELPDREYRDAAEVSRALGEIRSHEHKPQHQPSKKGGAQAMKSPSAARIASVFSGVHFPASAEELKDYGQDRANDDELAIIERFHRGTYRDMSDVAKELGRVI